jgi:hypothetical protein
MTTTAADVLPVAALVRRAERLRKLAENPRRREQLTDVAAALQKAGVVSHWHYTNWIEQIINHR